MTEAFAHQLRDSDANVRAAVFYPSGGLLDTGPVDGAAQPAAELARRIRPRPPAPGTTLRGVPGRSSRPPAATPRSMDLLELGRFVVRGVKAGAFIIGWDLRSAASCSTPGPTPSPRASCRRTPCI